MSEPIEYQTKPVKGASAFKKVAEERKDLYQEDLAREQHNHGRIRAPEEQVGTKTWKSGSQIRRPSRAFRRGFEQIVWKASTCRCRAGRH